jgi:hypothetical protein
VTIFWRYGSQLGDDAVPKTYRECRSTDDIPGSRLFRVCAVHIWCLL